MCAGGGDELNFCIIDLSLILPVHHEAVGTRMTQAGSD
jgi:hypothetical protein